jgi:hypothetical protein
MSSQWGHCQHCKHFDSPAHTPLPNEEARCLHPELHRFQLVVFGASGCRGFALRAGLQPDIEGPPDVILDEAFG